MEDTVGRTSVLSLDLVLHLSMSPESALSRVNRSFIDVSHSKIEKNAISIACISIERFENRRDIHGHYLLPMVEINQHLLPTVRHSHTADLHTKAVSSCCLYFVRTTVSSSTAVSCGKVVGSWC